MTKRLLRKPAVLDRFPVGTTQLYELIKEQKFPAPIKFGRASYWVEDEVDAAIEAFIAEHPRAEQVSAE